MVPTGSTAIIVLDSYVFTKRRKIGEGQAILYFTLGSLGVFLWALWNLAIWGNPLYFLDGSTSALSQQNKIAAAGQLSTKYNLLASSTTTLDTVYLNVGKLMSAVVILSLLCVIYINRKNKKVAYTLAVLLAPLVLDLITLFLGITVVTTSPLSNLFNVRYGLMAIPFIAVLVPLAIYALKLPKNLKLVLCACTLIVGLMAPLITLQDPLYGNSGMTQSTISYEQTVSKYYRGGNILASVSTYDPVMQRLGIPLKNYTQEGNYHIWDNALKHPENTANYIMMNNGNHGASSDLVYKDYLKRKALFNKYYYVAYNQNGYELLILKSMAIKEPA
jgi:hypothetical protein